MLPKNECFFNDLDCYVKVRIKNQIIQFLNSLKIYQYLANVYGIINSFYNIRPSVRVVKEPPC